MTTRALRERARAVALAGSSIPALFQALARHDSNWLVAHVEELARAAPDRGDALVGSFSNLPDGTPRKPLREKVRRALEMSTQER